MQFLIISSKAITISQIEMQLHGFGREVMLKANDHESAIDAYKSLDPDENVGKTVILKWTSPSRINRNH